MLAGGIAAAVGLGGDLGTSRRQLCDKATSVSVGFERGAMTAPGINSRAASGIYLGPGFEIGLSFDRSMGAGRMGHCLRAILLLVLASAVNPAQAAEPVQARDLNPAPTAGDWAALAKLPDWSGIWVPKIGDQHAQLTTNIPPWTPRAAAQIDHMFSEGKAGRPAPLFVNCLPEGMPSWMLITHNAMEVAFTPDRVTMLGESDGNRLRRIYTDGRGHPEDPDPTFFGHSIGHWESDTLVVDTVGVLPEVYIALAENAGVPNNGDMHIVERLHLQGPDILHDDLEITAPHVLTRPWQTTRIFLRQREKEFDIVEGVCVQGNYIEAVDKDGDHVFVPIQHQPGGNLVAPR
jgi:hypothetical protein